MWSRARSRTLSQHTDFAPDHDAPFQSEGQATVHTSQDCSRAVYLLLRVSSLPLRCALLLGRLNWNCCCQRAANLTHGFRASLATSLAFADCVSIETPPSLELLAEFTRSSRWLWCISQTAQTVVLDGYGYYGQSQREECVATARSFLCVYLARLRLAHYGPWPACVRFIGFASPSDANTCGPPTGELLWLTLGC